MSSEEFWKPDGGVDHGSVRLKPTQAVWLPFYSKQEYSVFMLKHLLKTAEKSRHKLFFHAALVVSGGRILSSGYNRGTLHAEVMALRKLSHKQRCHTTIWSIRVTNGGKLANAKPCPDCLETLRKSRVKTVIYSTAEGTIETLRIRSNTNFNGENHDPSTCPSSPRSHYYTPLSR